MAIVQMGSALTRRMNIGMPVAETDFGIRDLCRRAASHNPVMCREQRRNEVENENYQSKRL